jgi:alkanesulfonate monooxygenase SsuD/methylene tetrahydromethanopterin reductase-like flavin-dependent oxidoreductase (luciferase family)
MGGFDVTFGQAPNDGREQSLTRMSTFLKGIRGEVVGTVNEPSNGLTAGEPLTVRGASPALAERVWFGGGSKESAQRTAELGVNLMLSTIVTGDVGDYNAYQAEAIDEYREAYTGPFTPRVSISRSILPATSPETARLYAAYDEERRTQGPAASRPEGALEARNAELFKQSRFTMSPSIHGEPAAVVENLLSDPAVQAADDLICFLPPGFGLEQNIRLITDIVETVAPALGWSPALAPVS